MPGGYVVRGGRSRRGVQGRNYMPVLNRGKPPTSSNTSPMSRAVAYRPTARLRKVQIWNSAAGASQMLRRYRFPRSTGLLHSQTVSHHKSEGGWRRLLLFLRAAGQRRNWCQASRIEWPAECPGSGDDGPGSTGLMGRRSAASSRFAISARLDSALWRGSGAVGMRLGSDGGGISNTGS
jgi:hypothetical protein